MAAQQCSRCDRVADCIDSGMRALEDVADVLGVPTPSLHVHLVQHDRDDLLRELTYGGEPILPPADPAKAGGVEAPQPATDRGVEADPVSNEWPEGTDPQELVDAGLLNPDDLEDDPQPPQVTPFIVATLIGLRNDHPAETVRTAAGSLLTAINDHESAVADRIRLEQLVVQRDQLNDEIEQLSRKLGDTSHEDQQPKLQATAARQVTTPTSTIRTWCIANGIDVPARGVLPRDAMDAWRAAHPEAS